MEILKNSIESVNETRVLCPNCGAEVQIPKHEHAVSGMCIGKDSGLGDVFLKLEDRKQQLAERGIDASKYFSIKSPGGVDVLMKWGDNGAPEQVADDDPIVIIIRKSGNVPNRRLFRRWVMAQMFRGLTFKGWRGNAGGFTEWMKCHGYFYTWKQTIEELRVQSVLYRNDEENFRMRNRWFNKDVAHAMCIDYINQLDEYIASREIHRCKGVPYKKIGSRNVFISDIDFKILRPLREAARRVHNATTPSELYNAMRDFRQLIPHATELGFQQCREWQDAYKGSGAYFTMRNLIMFHGCNYVGCGNYDESLRELDKYATRCEGYELLGALKRMLRQNHIDIEKKMAEWRK